MIDLITIPRFCLLTGYSDDAVRAKMESGELREGRDWLIAPDGSLMMLAPGATVTVSDGYEPLVTLRKVRSRAISAFKLPTGSGIYFLFQNRRLEYIGQATHLMRRIGQHMAEGVIQFDSASWVNCDVDQLNRLESAYIKAYRPTLNQRGAIR